MNDVYSRTNLPKIKNKVYVINLNEYKSVRTHCIAFYVNDDNVTFFDSFGVEHIPKDIKKLKAPKLLKQIFIEYKHTIQQCVDTFVLNL